MIPSPTRPVSRVPVSRVPVTDPQVASRPSDYADAFAVDLPAPDDTWPVTWVGTGLSQVPPIVDWVAARLGFAIGTGDPLDGWVVESSGPDAVHLVVDLPTIHVDFVGRNLSPTRRTLTTAVTYTRPRLGRLVLAVIAPAHRRTVRWVLARSVPTPVAA
jgi:hypothetical protein